jgi:sugar transferase (PEP-CTERM/EpsH1 system associated)
VKIEMILPSLIAAGMETVTARLAMQLAAAGHTVGVTCLLDEGPLASELRAAGHRVAVVPAPGLRTNVMPVQLAAWLRSEQPDVVHAHSGTWLKAARAARLAGVRRVVFTEHGLNDVEPWYNLVVKRCGGWLTDCVVAVSEPLRHYLVERVGIPESKIVVIPNGVDTDRFSPGPAHGDLRARLGLGSKPVIGHVARLAPVKNQPLLVDALARVRERVPEAQLVIVGDGPEREALQAHIQARGLEESVHLAGEARDVPAILREFDVFALPSKAEGTSMSVLEAMASGIPVVASAVGGTPDLLDHGRCGVLVEPNDVDALAVALADVLLAPDRRRVLAAAARTRVVQDFDEAAVARRYEGLYRGAGALGAASEDSPTPTAVCAG